MKFITGAVKLPDNTLSAVIKENMQVSQRHRGYKHIHASDLTKDHFCPREVCLIREYDLPLPKEYLTCALRLTFDIGNTTAQLIADEWAGQAAIGNWRCSVCGGQRSFTRKPKPCGCKPWARWSYQEVNFVDKESKASGNLDLIVDIGEPKYRIVELKIIKPEDFADVKAPLAEHKVRTSLYLDIIKNSSHPYRKAINTQEGIVMYVSRGYGKKVEGLGVLPFKEFKVKSDPTTDVLYQDRARAITFYEEKKQPLPPRTCESAGCKRATKCNAVSKCFEINE